jgi:hypothetical protein
MPDVTVAAQGGRAAAIAHRKALSAGKAALPPAQERVRAGTHAAARLAGPVVPEPIPVAPVAVAGPQIGAAPPAPVATPSGSAVIQAGGRAASMQRRRQLSNGKAALPHGAAPAASVGVASVAAAGTLQPATGRLASMARRRQLSGGKSAPLPPTHAGSAGPAPVLSAHLQTPPPAQGCAAPTCRDLARARRAAIASGGRAGVAAPPAALATPQGTITYPPKVTESGTQGGQRVTGIRIGEGRQVTGAERGTLMPVSGTPYIDTDSGTAYRPAAPKVGLMRTAGGQTVSGTLVRSQVRITGDEAGGAVGVTGKVDPRLDDDLTPRGGPAGFASAQFQRQANPHGSGVFGANLGRSVKSAGSRDRSRAMAIETTQQGQVVTGSALGRSVRMTGDEAGACRAVTGNQYLAPARAQVGCGAMPPATGAGRPDPVTASKVSVSASWGGQRITGMDVEHNPRVTGDEPGSCSALTGSQYQGRSTTDGWCDPASASAAAARRPARAVHEVTGDTPLHGNTVTGIARGAGRDITGTPYHATVQASSAAPADPVATLDARFSVRSPQRAAHLLAGAAVPALSGNAARITGSFAVGGGKVTGNGEFLVRPRSTQAGDKPPAHNRITGEGMAGGRITGDAWGTHGAVTGTEGAFAAGRNPSTRGPKAKAFAGSTVFKSQAVYEEPKQLVTGMFYFAKSGARVTLSGGAQG